MSKVSCIAARKHRRCDFANGAAELLPFFRSLFPLCFSNGIKSDIVYDIEFEYPCFGLLRVDNDYGICIGRERISKWLLMELPLQIWFMN